MPVNTSAIQIEFNQPPPELTRNSSKCTFEFRAEILSLSRKSLYYCRLSLFSPCSTVYISISCPYLVEKMLMNKQNFKSAKDVDGFVPQASGLYCIRIKNVHLLPEPFGTILLERGHDILYIGIASENLYNRFLNQELRAKGHGTFFRSMGAVLGYKPPKGSLIEKRNKKNYKFSKTDELKIIGWINENLMVNWVESAGDLDSLETSLIVKYLPLLNLSKNPAALQILSYLRKECVEIANRN